MFTITRKQFVMLPIVAGLLALTGCEPTTETPTVREVATITEPSQAPEPAAPLSLDGLWRQTNPNDPATYMEATIADDIISVNWIMDAGATSAVYWQGTYAAPTDPGDSYAWTSSTTLDTGIINIMASQDDAKDFSYQGGVLSWRQSALGVTTTVECSRV